MSSVILKLKTYFIRGLWDIDISGLNGFRAFIIKFLRLLYVAAREFTEGHLTLRAMGLVYTTLLSLVPLLAFSFSVLKGFGVHNQIEPLLSNFLAPLGHKGEELTWKVIGFVENVKVGVLGTLGLSMLVYTVISLIQKIESALNAIWKIRRPRSFARRFSDYMSVILIGPVLMFSAMGLTASVMSTTVVQGLVSIEPFGTVVYLAGKLIPYLLVCAAFTFIYSFVPNTKVRPLSALVGGVFAGILWETTGWAFASFVISSTKYTAIYSGFAIVVMSMIWLYVSWLILLVGAEISFYHQYPQFLTVKKESLLLSNRLKERLAVLVMFLIGDNFYRNGKPWTLNSLVDRLNLPLEPVQDVLSALQNHGYLLETNDDPPAFLPARDIETIHLRELLSSVRIAEENSSAIEEKFLSLTEVDRMMQKVDDAVKNALGKDTLKDLVQSAGERIDEGSL
jgi:membrane protein